VRALVRAVPRWAAVLVAALAATLSTACSGNLGTDLSGRWTSNDYTCPQVVPHHELFDVLESGTTIVGVKVVGDDCVPAGRVSFQGTISSSAGKVDIYEAAPHGTPQITLRNQPLTIQGGNHFAIGQAGAALRFQRTSGPLESGPPWWIWLLIALVGAGVIVLLVMAARRARADRRGSIRPPPGVP
jgi:hypothetical protein